MLKRFLARMRAITISLLVFASFVNASDLKIDKIRFEEALKENRVGERNRILEGILSDLIDQLRDIMVNGTENIPVLDPLRIGEIEVGESIFETPKSFIKIGETRVDNLSTFVFDTLNIAVEGIILQRYILSFDTHIPEINVNTNGYDMNFVVMGGQVFGSGAMSVNIVKPRIKGRLSTSLRINNGMFLTINDCEIQVSLGDFQPTITGMWNSEVASSFVSRFLGNLVPELMTFFKYEINQILSDAVKTIGNEILKDINVIDLIRP
ncbi:uncharacterized protein LOC110991266 isoform X1 [Pieris rapae]|uniref:uncharacterized protein LOC110991266 isoform X1 n=2 Tax=Pieris rapae TaxID=64459 RepID=UPI001E28097C|nr:uncharacterized protein LOC110991266 isoform X1 [Pieris rapae]